jgi:type IV pilus assembly protein PilA
MLETLRKRLERDEDGFTLIELMVVVLIIAILLAIAIPTFLGARERANDRASQSSLRNTVTAAKTLFTDSQDYEDATTTALTGIEPSLTYVATGTASTGAKSVSVFGGTVSATTVSATFFAAVKSASGSCFYIRDVAAATNGGTMYAKGASSATCSATAAAALDPTTGWSAAW